MPDFSPELRKDPISGRWVIISSARAQRPEAPEEPRREEESPEARARCPFCYGHEEMTPPEITLFPYTTLFRSDRKSVV